MAQGLFFLPARTWLPNSVVASTRVHRWLAAIEDSS
jgi:hypothetical protein